MPTDQAITAAGAILALAGLALVFWALFADHIRTRALRASGSLRRCPKCWYDVSAVDGLTCPECGRTAKRERSLARPRRRYRRAAAALPLLLLAGALLAAPHAADGRWQRWLPDTAVLLAMRFAPEPAWAVEEFARRAWGDANLPRVESPNRFSRPQLRLLTDASLRIVADPTKAGSRYAAWGFLTRLSAEPERALEIAVRQLRSPSAQLRYGALRHLTWTRDRLSDAQILELIQSLESLPPPQTPSNGANLALTDALTEDLRETLAARSDGGHQLRLAAARELALSPHEIAGALADCTPDEQRIVYERLGLSRSPPPSGAERPNAAFRRVAALAINLNDDALPDCILEIDDGEGQVRDRLCFVRTPGAWRCIGRLEGPWSAPQPGISVVASDGRRWVRLRYTDGLSGRADQIDAWYRVAHGRLRLVQLVTASSEDGGYLARTLASQHPTVVRSRGRDFAVYQMAARIALTVPDRGSAPRILALDQRVQEFRFPLDAPPGAFGLPTGARFWGGDCPDWFITALEEDLLPPLLPRLLDLARTGDRATLDQLETLISVVGETKESALLRAALNER
ncbi:MAG TPA: hypothetical protein VFF69_09875 [Phycisphaerales bacterium]|nr:hypothetical protein [Phycisphaerales bacterium]